MPPLVLIGISITETISVII